MSLFKIVEEKEQAHGDPEERQALLDHKVCTLMGHRVIIIGGGLIGDVYMVAIQNI